MSTLVIPLYISGIDTGRVDPRVGLGRNILNAVYEFYSFLWCLSSKRKSGGLRAGRVGSGHASLISSKNVGRVGSKNGQRPILLHLENLFQITGIPRSQCNRHQQEGVGTRKKVLKKVYVCEHLWEKKPDLIELVDSSTRSI